MDKFLDKQSELKQKINNLEEFIKRYDLINIDSFQTLKKDIARDLKISVFAELSTGKSTFLNALIFKENFLHMETGETTFAIYNISYGETLRYRVDGKSISVNNKDDILKEIKRVNEQNKDIERLSYVEIEINNKYLKGVSIIDTPGFGSISEDILKDAFIEVVAKSDGVIFLFDISKGAKAEDVKKSKVYLESISKDKIWIVLNKIDTVRAEDREIIKVAKDTLIGLSHISRIEKVGINNFKDLKKYKTYPLSAQVALEAKQGIGYDRRNKKIKLSKDEIAEDFKYSRFNYFEEDFFNQLPQERYDVLLKLEKEINQKRDEVIESLKIEIKELEMRVEERNKEVISFQNQKHKNIDELEDLKSSWTLLNRDFIKNREIISMEKRKQYNKNTINNCITNISNEIINNISKRLDEFSFTDTFNAKERVETLINQALRDSEFKISDEMKIYLNYRLKNIISSTISIENSVRKFNYNTTLSIKKFSQLNLDGNIIKINKKLDLKILDGLALNGLLQPIIATIVGVIVYAIVEFIASRLALTFIPVVGQVIALFVGVGMLFAGKSMSDKIKEKVMPETKESIPKAVKEAILRKLEEPLNSDLRVMEYKINNFILDISSKISTKIKILESNSKEKEEEIAKYKIGISKLQDEIEDKSRILAEVRSIK